MSTHPTKSPVQLAREHLIRKVEELEYSAKDEDNHDLLKSRRKAVKRAIDKLIAEAQAAVINTTKD